MFKKKNNKAAKDTTALTSAATNGFVELSNEQLEHCSGGAVTLHKYLMIGRRDNIMDEYNEVVFYVVGADDKFYNFLLDNKAWKSRDHEGFWSMRQEHFKSFVAAYPQGKDGGYVIATY